MSHRIPSTLIGPIPVTGSDGNTTLEYVEGPTLWQRIAFEWQYSGIVGRIGLVLLVIAASPLLALGSLVSLVALIA